MPSTPSSGLLPINAQGNADHSAVVKAQASCTLTRTHLNSKSGRLYSPDLNPIEKALAKLKQLLRSARAKTKVALKQTIAGSV